MPVTNNKHYPPSCEFNEKQVSQTNEELSIVGFSETKNIPMHKTTSLPPSYWGEDSRKYSKDK